MMARRNVDNAKPEHFGFLLLPGFPLAALASAVDVLALANYVSERPLYRWSTISAGPAMAVAMNGFRFLVDHEMSETPPFDTIVVCCGIAGSRQDSSGLLGWLRDRYAEGSTICAISTGTWLLAQAGLLRGRRCTIHWEDLQSFRETYPDVKVTSEIFEIDGRLFTCSGGSSAIDMFLSFVSTRHGAGLAAAVSDQLVHGQVRADDTRQRPGTGQRVGVECPPVVGAVDLMERNLETPITLGAMAERLGTSGRHLERLFHKHLATTPQLYYRSVRLRHARALLRSTSMPIAEIAFASGFSTPSYLAKCYRTAFGRLPGEERNQSSTAFASGSFAKESTP